MLKGLHPTKLSSLLLNLPFDKEVDPSSAVSLFRKLHRQRSMMLSEVGFFSPQRIDPSQIANFHVDIRRRLNDGSAAPIPSDASLVGRVLPASYLERTREEREREKHELAKKQQALSREQYELEQKRDERDQKRFEWEQTKHLVETALKIRELDIIPLEAAMIKARALYGQARDEDQAEATL